MEGDFIFLKWRIKKEINILWDHFKVRTNEVPLKEQYFYSFINAPCKIVGVFSNSGGKLPTSDNSKSIIMEIEHYYSWISPYLNFNDSDTSIVKFKEFLKGEFARPYDFADYVIMNFPDQRVDFYKTSDYDEMQNKVIKYINKLVNKLGFFPESVN